MSMFSGPDELVSAINNQIPDWHKWLENITYTFLKYGETLYGRHNIIYDKTKPTVYWRSAEHTHTHTHTRTHAHTHTQE